MKALVLVLAAVVALAGTPAWADRRCPGHEVLEAIALDAWAGPPVRPSCLAIRGHERLTLVIDTATLDGRTPSRGFDPVLEGGRGYAAIVDHLGQTRWVRQWSGDTPGDVRSWQLVDLDGDGRDELVEDSLHIGHMGSSQGRLIVSSLDTGSPVEVAELPLHDSFPKCQNACRSSHRLVRRNNGFLIEVTGTRETDPQFAPVSDVICPRAGRHRYAWNGSDVKETR